MNDPHVKALYYGIILGKDIDYENAPPLLETTDDFVFSLDQKSAIFTMKQHCATVEEARSILEEYLKPGIY